MNFQDTMPGWLKKVLGIEAIEFKDSPSAKGDSNSTTNNNNNDNRNISIMTNKEVDKKGAGGLASIIQEQSFVGV